jgi:hypothetical protein
MGSDWSAVTVAALVDQLAELRALGSGRSFLAIPEGGRAKDAEQKRFGEAIERYLAQRP